jgi:hypothetical protein
MRHVAEESLHRNDCSAAESSPPLMSDHLLLCLPAPPPSGAHQADRAVRLRERAPDPSPSWRWHRCSTVRRPASMCMCVGMWAWEWVQLWDGGDGCVCGWVGGGGGGGGVLVLEQHRRPDLTIFQTPAGSCPPITPESQVEPPPSPFAALPRRCCRWRASRTATPPRAATPRPWWVVGGEWWWRVVGVHKGEGRRGQRAPHMVEGVEAQCGHERVRVCGGG